MQDSPNDSSPSEPGIDLEKRESGYFLLIGERKQGPYNLGELKVMWVRGEINADTLYTHPGMAKWEGFIKDTARHFAL